MENENTLEQQCFDIGMIYLDEKKWDDAFKFLTLSADFGYEKASKELFTLWDETSGLDKPIHNKKHCRQNHTAMFDFYSRKGKGPYSLHYLTYMYLSGLGVEKNRFKALECYRENIDFPWSRYCLAVNLKTLGFFSSALKKYLWLDINHKSAFPSPDYLSDEIEFCRSRLVNCNKFQKSGKLCNLLADYFYNNTHLSNHCCEKKKYWRLFL